MARKSTTKINKKLSEILEYKAEFEAEIEEEATRLPNKKPFCDKISRTDPINDIIVCAKIIGDVDENDEVLETVIERNPYIFTANLSFTFKNEPRVQFSKYAADYVFSSLDSDEQIISTVGDPLIDIALSGGTGLYISYGHYLSQTYINFCNFVTLTADILGRKCKIENTSCLFSIMELQGNNLNDVMNNNSELEIRGNKSGTVNIKAVTENQLDCGETVKEVLDKYIQKTRKEKSPKPSLICRIRIRGDDPGDDGNLYLVCLVIPGLSSNPSHARSAEHMKNSAQALKDCLIGRARTAVNPDQSYNIPYEQAMVTRMLREVMDVDGGRQSRVVLLGNISNKIQDLEESTDTLKLLGAVKAAPKKEENVKHPEENPVNWDCYEVNMWLRLTHDIDIDPGDLLSGCQLLRMTRREFVEFFLGRSSVTSGVAVQIWADMWQLYGSCRAREGQRKLSRKKQFETKDLPKKSYFEILNGDMRDEDDKINSKLGTSKRQFEASLNTGFEQNLHRFAAKNAEMMAMEWSNKVAASERAEAKLYPVLGIAAEEGAGKVGADKKRKKSIYQ